MLEARSDSGSVRRLRMSDLYWLTDEQMTRLQPYFPKSHGKPRVDDRRVLSGIVFVNRNGLRWRDAPSAYGPHTTLYRSEEHTSEVQSLMRISYAVFCLQNKKKNRNDT